jgi:predicted ABC-type transport system involved in lysophospholipase L1 biosynthesis ATPase subunit
MGKKKAISADGQRVQVLHEVDGVVEKGEMLAIIGACSARGGI